MCCASAQKHPPMWTCQTMKSVRRRSPNSLWALLPTAVGLPLQDVRAILSINGYSGGIGRERPPRVIPALAFDGRDINGRMPQRPHGGFCNLCPILASSYGHRCSRTPKLGLGNDLALVQRLLQRLACPATVVVGFPSSILPSLFSVRPVLSERSCSRHLQCRKAQSGVGEPSGAS